MLREGFVILGVLTKTNELEISTITPKHELSAVAYLENREGGQTQESAPSYLKGARSKGRHRSQQSLQRATEPLTFYDIGLLGMILTWHVLTISSGSYADVVPKEVVALLL